MCGVPLSPGESAAGGLCSMCAQSQAVGASESAGMTGPELFSSFAPAPANAHPDPDQPPWGPFAGVSVWMASVAAVVLVPVVAVALWLLIQSARGAPLPNFRVREEVEQWVMSPNILLLQILATMAAHAITLAICWAVVTRVGSRPFWASLGWNWGGHRILYWLMFSACVLLTIQILSQVLVRFISEQESPFDQMLKSSQQVRIAVAALAVLTAPVVEEIVYRGVLFSALRKRIGPVATVTAVTVTFAGVHVFQNRGAWVSIIGLTVLSFALTMVRAKSKSILPCVFIHTFNNAFASMVILINKGS